MIEIPIENPSMYLRVLRYVRECQDKSCNGVSPIDNFGHTQAWLQNELRKYDLKYNSHRRGWCKFVTTLRRFWFECPEPDDIDIEDIAHALSMICRFGGHVRYFYSVAQHSVYVSRLVRPENAMLGLFHDGSEAYTGDIITPLKRMLGPVFAAMEDRISDAVYKHFDIEHTAEIYKDVKRADLIMLNTEARDLTTAGVLIEHPGVAPWDFEITEAECWSPKEAKRQFLKRYEELRSERDRVKATN